MDVENKMQTGYLPEPYCNLCFTEQVKRWDEAIPLGNGLMGCLVWGDGLPLRLSLDRGDLWDTRVAPEVLAPDYKYEELIKLVAIGDQQAITERFDRFYERPAPTKIPAGALELDFGVACSGMESRLSLSNALCEIHLQFGERYSRIRTFLHAANFMGYISITGSTDIPQILLKAPGYACLPEKEDKPEGLKVLGYPEAEYNNEGSLSWFHQKIEGTLEYALIIAEKKNGTDHLEVVYLVASSLDGENWLGKAKERLTEALENSFDEELKEHEAWWRRFWKKSAIRLCDKEYERLWYISNYLFGSCSRKGFPPMPLQGLWTADDGGLPPWKGDYHHDLNTQMSYWHYLKANHLEEGECFIDLLWNLVQEAHSFAHEFFDAPGSCLPSVMSIDGKSLGGWPMYCTNLVNQIWLCQAFDHYWQYTGDQDFLRNKAYNYFHDTALCILRWLTPGKDGKLFLPLSSSPEIYDNTHKAWLTPNSNYDLSLLIYLFKTLAEMAKLLGNGEDTVWEEKLRLLPELAVTEDYVLMISPDEQLTESHRHHAHAMAIYPLKILNYSNGEKDKAIIDATVANLELLGTGLWVGFSFPWMAEFYAIQGNGEGAAYQLKLFGENFCSQNGFHLNGDYKRRGVSRWHYRPFTLEANMCAADALQEMLLQDDGGVIRVFPAVPEEWRVKGASFSNLRGKRGILISSAIKGRKVSYITLKSANSGEYAVENAFETDYGIVIRKERTEKIQCNQYKKFVLKICKGEECTLRNTCIVP
jgi:hypothetical protein